MASAVKLVKVVNEYQLINGRPRITFIGSNGLRYCFTIGLLPDRRASGGSQVAALLNGLLEKHSQSKQRALALFALQSVPLSVDMQMTESPPQVSSLVEILTFEKAEESVSGFKKVVDSVSGKNPERTAFEQFVFSDNYLTNFVMERSCHAVDFYAASKRFTKSLAVVSIVDHLLGISAVERPLSADLRRG
jgi:phosphatidylinositol kinase/protein kinase (PI-3  family)